VRAQRQWALRRLRARARPNSANLAVLGQPAVLQALAELCAVSSSNSDCVSSSSDTVSSSSRSDSIAAYAARRDAAAALSVASHLPANAVRMATEPLLSSSTSTTTATNGTAAAAGASAASAGAATVSAALCTLCADAGAGGEARGHAAVALGNVAHSGGAAARDTLGQLGAVEALLSIVQAAVSSRTQVLISTSYKVQAAMTARNFCYTALRPFNGGCARPPLRKLVDLKAQVL
jgi:hypothetical protein